MAASLTRLARSAPEKPGVPRATTSRSTPGPAACRGQWTSQDREALGQRGQRDGHLAVEPTRPEEGRVEDLGPVGGGEDHDAGSRVESVHLGEQLVEGLLPLVVGDDRARATSALADGVDLVDEDDRRRPLAGLFEQVADPRRADARRTSRRSSSR